MARQLIATTRRDALRPLALQGVLVHTQHAQIAGLLASRFSHRHGALFAEPVFDPKNDAIDWYAHAQGPVRKLADLNPAEQERARAEIGDLAQDVAARGEELEASQDRDQASIGRILAMALNYPGDEYIYMVGDQPVIVCWSLVQGGPGVQAQSLTRFARVRASDARPVVPPPVTPVVGPAALLAPAYPWWMFLIWFLIGVLLALALLLLMDRLRPAIDRDAALAVEREYLAARQEEAALRHELVMLRAAYGERLLACQEPEPEPEPVIEPEPEPEPVIEPEPEPEPEPVIEPEPEPEPEPVIEPEPEPMQTFAPGDMMSIPDEARQNNDFSFLEGCWQSSPFRYRSDQRGTGISVYCFDQSGRGQLNYHRADRHCRTRAWAQFEADGTMRLVDEDGWCSDGAEWHRDNVTCANNQGGVAVCSGWAQGFFPGAIDRWNYTLTKLP